MVTYTVTPKGSQLYQIGHRLVGLHIPEIHKMDVMDVNYQVQCQSYLLMPGVAELGPFSQLPYAILFLQPLPQQSNRYRWTGSIPAKVILNRVRAFFDILFGFI